MKLKNDERLILDLMCLDKKIFEIALILNFSKSSIEKKISALKLKYDCNTLTALIFKYTL